ncbi:hypothetical protein PF004_g3808 [Phytophthora fragariae]|uniref:DUF659 domain-containing protein n=1 Tax=Phytophthora fragariae TaxID=53985 RepID=A0A6G0PKK4_9STRA|nr:hypothetical protein PF004_g3808 [Phytophthora fragariae]
MVANISAWELLQLDSPRGFFHGRACHALHLLLTGTVSKITWLDGLISSCKFIVSFFKTNHKFWLKLRAKLTSLNLKVLALPGDTRWCSILACLTGEINEETEDSVSWFYAVKETAFVSKLKRATTLLKQFGEPLKRFRKKSTPVLEVFQLFLDMPKAVGKCGLPAKDAKTVKTLISERFDFVNGDAHGVGHLPDPRFCGAQMDSDARTNVEEFIAQWHDADYGDEEKADAVWEGYHELTLEPVMNISWQAVRVFEREMISAVWLYKSTRGRRRKLRRERQTRSSPRFS